MDFAKLSKHNAPLLLKMSSKKLFLSINITRHILDTNGFVPT